MILSPFPDLPHCSFHWTSETETSQDKAHHLESAGCPLTAAGHQTKAGEHLMEALAASHLKAVYYLNPVLLAYLESAGYLLPGVYLKAVASSQASASCLKPGPLEYRWLV